MTFRYVATLLACCLLASACYTFKGYSITPETETFYVEQFDVTTLEGPPEMGQQFTEIIKQRINSDTRLVADEVSPDVEFAGAVSRLEFTPEAPNAQNLSDQTRLTIAISVEFVDHVTEKNSYTQTFTDYVLFDAQLQPLDVQEELIGEIFERISEDAFNKAFSNW